MGVFNKFKDLMGFEPRQRHLRDMIPAMSFRCRIVQ